jgi:hypothetical protein
MREESHEMSFVRHFAKASILVALAAVMGCAGDGNDNGLEILNGESQLVDGQTVRTFAVRDNGVITQVGVSLPFELITNPPAAGAGPAGAFASVVFPDAARAPTFFDHMELHWNPMGHEPPIYMVPHFDIHGYGVPELEVFDVSPPDSVAPEPNRLPPGFVYPGVEAAVPQMGVHAVNPADLEGDFTEVMIHGYWGGKMTFIEPMITQAKLETKQDIVLPIGKPEVLGRATRYPTRFRAVYDEDTNSYNFIYDNFESIE